MSAKAAIAALKAQIATVYPTLTGRDALVTTSASLPVLTLYSVGDAQASEQDYEDLTFTRRLIVEFKITAASTYDEVLDDALAAIRAVIQPDVATGEWWGGHALRVQEISTVFYPPEPNGNVAMLQINLEFDYRP